MIFTGNRKIESTYKIITMEGRLGGGMSLWAFEMTRAQRIQGESIRNNQIIFMNYELGTVDMDNFFSQIVEE